MATKGDRIVGGGVWQPRRRITDGNEIQPIKSQYLNVESPGRTTTSRNGLLFLLPLKAIQSLILVPL